MGTFGKILLFVNLLAAGGVAYLGTQDWAKRQEIQANALIYKVNLVGLPMEASKDRERTPESVPFEVELSGGYVTTDVKQSLLDTLFRGADGGPNFGNRSPQPSSQIEEVKAVQAKCNQMLSGSEAQQLEVLCGKYGEAAGNSPRPFTAGWLVGMAENYEVRDLVRRLADTPTVNPGGIAEAAKTARDMLDKRFQAVLSAPNPQVAEQEAVGLKSASENLRTAAAASQQALTALNALYQQNPPPSANAPEVEAARKAATAALDAEGNAFNALKKSLTDLGTTASRDNGDRQKRIAHLLMHLDASPAWQKRIATVVGLRTYVKVVGEHAVRLRGMAVSAEQQIMSDQATFSEEYQLLSTLAAQRAVLVYKQRAVTADLKSQKQLDRAAVNARTVQYQSHLAELARIRGEVDTALARQTDTEGRLFEIERRFGDTLARNADLEKKLEEAERKKAGN